MPYISIAKLTRMPPIFFFFSFFAKRRNATPISASTGENDDGLSIFIKTLEPSIDVRLSSQDVTVVPMLAPIMMPIA